MRGLDKKRKQIRRLRTSKPPLFVFFVWLKARLYQLRAAILFFWENITIFSRRLKLNGWKKLTVEILDEALTLGLIAFTILTFVGVSIFQLTKQDFNVKEDYAVNFLDRNGNAIGNRGALQSKSVPIFEMPDYVVKAVLATEDRRFFEHWGIDFYGLARAMTQNIRANEVVQGGSTITQQLAKNLFLTNDRTFERKIKEAYLSLWLEMNYSKEEILQLYLDRAYMGGGAFGIAAASQFYFGKDIRDVSLAEAAMLAGLFKAPSKYAPHVNLPAARARANVVLSNLVHDGLMTEGQVIGARRHPATIVTELEASQPNYFLDWAFEEIKKMGDTLPSHNITVRTTLDLGIQKAAEESIEYNLRQYGEQYNVSQAAAVILDNDGSVRALVGGRDYGESQFNRATQSGRQPGSSFKPYVYAVAMERGLTPKTVINDAPINWGGWRPHNSSGRYSGNVDIATAFAFSINTVPVRITYDYLNRDTQPIRDLIKNMGVDADIFAHKTMVLGTSNMTPLDQATGFNVFANGGMAGNRHAFTQIYTSDGGLIWDYAKNGVKPWRALSEKSSSYINQMMVGVTTRGSGKNARLPMTLVAGKTGTSQSYRDAWFVGFTGNFTTAVWMGNDDYSPMKRAFGGGVPALMWQRMMLYAQQTTKTKPLFGVKNSILNNKSPVKNQKNPNDFTSDIPQMLSINTSNVLRKIVEDFQNTPTLSPPSSDKLASSMRQIH